MCARDLFFFLFSLPTHSTFDTYIQFFIYYYYLSSPCRSNGMTISVRFSMHAFISVMCIIQLQIDHLLSFNCEYRLCIIILCAMPNFVVYVVYMPSVLLWFVWIFCNCSCFCSSYYSFSTIIGGIMMCLIVFWIIFACKAHLLSSFCAIFFFSL